MQLPVVATAGWLLFGEHVDRWTVAGTFIILASSAYIAHREAVLAKRRQTREPLKSVEPAT
jgi:drug/metabolite transporter (DMT)-like permease